ncbi:MAG: thiamine pyrophosphate-dependent enzyme [Chloroflexota bacterium]
MEQYDGAEAFIEVLNANGVEHIFFNPGGEMGALLATISKFRILGKQTPRLILCLDESVALTAAHGHYMVSGRPQVVMVHSELGTLQLGGALHNAQWGRIPVILWAGAQAVGQRKNWMNEPYDQGMSVRNCVKWDHTIKPDENIHDVLQKAFQTAFTEPCGPVYLCYPRDAIGKKIDRVTIPRSAIVPAPAAAPVDVKTLSGVADALIEAKNPLILAGYTGRYPESVASLVELAETLCAPVLTGPVWMNFPTTHPLCAGIEQILGSRKANPYLADADTILVIDYDVPYASAPGLPGPQANIIHFDVDPLTAGRPLWGRGANTFIKADSRQVIPALSKAIRQKLTPEKQTLFRERFNQLESVHKKQHSEWRAMAVTKAHQVPISPDWLCHCLAQLIDENTILLHHTISQSASATEQIDRTKPGTLMGCAAGSIQWALGAAFGAKIAAPDKTVVSIMTDGGFVWGSPVATLWPAVSYKAPFLAVILNNQSYGFIKLLVQRNYGEVAVTDQIAFEAGVDIMPAADYAAVARACGAYGRTLENPDDVLPVLREAIDQVRSGRPAVVDVRTEREVKSA